MSGLYNDAYSFWSHQWLTDGTCYNPKLVNIEEIVDIDLLIIIKESQVNMQPKYCFDLIAFLYNQDEDN